jgi:hypothetical protein
MTPKTMISNYGEWRIDEIKVRIHSDTSATISCEKYVVNSPTKIKNVKLKLSDRWNEITFEERLMIEYKKFKEKLAAENINIRQQKELEKKIKNLMKE